MDYQSEPATNDAVPVRIGLSEHFERVSAALRAAHFDEETVCRVLQIEDMADLGSIKPESLDGTSESEQFVLFCRFFLCSQSISRNEAEQTLGQETLNSFLSLGLLRTSTFSGAESCHTPVFFYPVAGFWIASDRRDNVEGSPDPELPDLVCPAIFGGTLRFLRWISKTPARDVLDLCGGTGIGAMVLSRTSKRAVSSDLATRAGQYARFNRMLNGCDNVEVAVGDLYQTVQGQDFDRIISHPPYMPSLGKGSLWSDGGGIGEVLIRRIIEGLPEHLRQGGTCYAACMGADTQEGLFEERARTWLGDSHGEFDILFGLADDKSPSEFAADLGRAAHGWDASKVDELQRIYDQAGVIRVTYGALVIHRCGSSTDRPWTCRFHITNDTQGADLEWVVQFHQRWTRASFTAELSDCRPHPSPHLRIREVGAGTPGGPDPSQTLLETAQPFVQAIRINSWVVPLLRGFDGKRSTAEVYSTAIAEGRLPGTLRFGDFVALVGKLIERKLLLI